MNGKVLIIDDEAGLRGLLERIIGLEGFSVQAASSGKQALKLIEKEDFDVILSDIKLPDVHGLQLLKELRIASPMSEIILLTAYGTIRDGVEAIQSGAFDYITKGDDNDKIIPLIFKACEKSSLRKKIKRLEEKFAGKYHFGKIIGKSARIKEAIALAERVAGTDTTILLTGETGTGKEVFAQAIHYNGIRKEKNFVALNCSAFGKDILESELFGYVAGAFTGAVKNKKGLFEEAHEGTLFLDEIGEMPADLQAKLLRVLETGTFIKVGDTKPLSVNVRLIAATNRDLEKEATEGNFRLDLFYRLNVFRIHLPALRERTEDIPVLVNFYIDEFSVKLNKKITGAHEDFLAELYKHPWKGNIRELKNIIERAIILADKEMLTLSCLPMDFNFSSQPGDLLFAMSLQEMEKQHIRKVLAYTKGNKTETARLLNIGLTTLYRKIEEYQL